MPAPDVIPAPPAQPPRYGLIAAAAIAEGAERWEMGATWEPEGCGIGDSGPYDCAPLAARDDDRNGGGAVIARPLLLWAIDSCSALGFHGRDWIGRARRALAASESFQLAQEMWTGAIATGAGSETPYLADDETLVLEDGDPVELGEALPLLEHAAARCSHGRRMMLHVPVQVLALMRDQGSNYVERDGALLTTDIGSIVVADAGYPGTGPDATQGSGGADVGNHWLYSSAVVSVRLGAVETFPRTLDDARELGAMVDRSVNNAVAWAQRTALYQLEPCCRFAVQTDVPVPTIPT
jgi:hypothetical protein